MEGKNTEALASAYRRAKAKSIKIKELGITPTQTTEETDKLIELLAKKKEEATGTSWKDHVKGQRWYVEDLIRFSSLTAQERLNLEYENSFADIASEDEMLAKLEELV